MEAAATCSLLSLTLLLVASASLSPTSALPMPPYIKACSRNDPKLDECAKKSALEAIPSILKGDPKYNVPPLNPLKVSKIKMDGGEGNVGLVLTVTDASLFGFTEAELQGIHIDLAKKQVVIKVSVPSAQVLGDYEVGGKVLLLPITGKGRANITLIKLELEIKVDWQLEKRDGKEYIKPVGSDIKYDMSRCYMHLDGLFGGNKVLGDNMNEFLNENWRDVVKELGPAVAQTMEALILQLVAGITHHVAYNEVFPEKV